MLNSQKDILNKFTKTLGSSDLKLAKSFTRNDYSILNMPPKIIEIEAKIEKFRQEKLKHEIIAKRMKDKEEALDYADK